MEKFIGKVLLADDDEPQRQLMKKLMADMGFEIGGEAVDGQEAVDLYRKIRPDLLLMDLNMPQKNGEAALEEIMHEFPGSLVIMTTSMGRRAIEDCLIIGAASYINKGSRLEEIKESIMETWEEFHKAGKNLSSQTSRT